MVPRNTGTIVQVGSALAYRAIPLQSAYCAAKHALAGFTESLRTELLHDGSASESAITIPGMSDHDAPESVTRTIPFKMVETIFRIWLETRFAGGRHARRIAETTTEIV